MNSTILNRRPFHPLILLVLFDALAFVLLFLRKTPYDTTALIIGSSLIAATLVIYFLTTGFKLGDRYVFLISVMLFSIGELMLYRLDAVLGVKQAQWFGLSLIVYFISYFLAGFTRLLKKLLYLLPILSIALFAVTMALGTVVNGSRNWIFIGTFSIQTSEIAKLLFVFFLACYYNQREKLLERFPKLGVTLAFMAVSYMMIGLPVLQKEWGTPMLLFLVFSLMLYIQESRLSIFLLNLLAATSAASIGILFMSHIQVRVEAWLNPWQDVAGKGYQIAQSLFAIGAGEFFGTGVGLGQPHFIPDVTTDFIFSAICEELGLFGGAAVILLFMLLAYRGFKIALGCSDTFSKTLALGITLMFAFQSFVIIAGVIKFFLLTGITLPFISYGGSSMMINLAALGILQRLSAVERGLGREAGG